MPEKTCSFSLWAPSNQSKKEKLAFGLEQRFEVLFLDELASIVFEHGQDELPHHVSRQLGSDLLLFERKKPVSIAVVQGRRLLNN